MTNILMPPLRPHFFEHAEHAQKSILLVAPYIKYQIARQLVDTLHRCGSIERIDLQVITNVNTTDFLSRASDIEALETLFKSVPNIKITGIGNLHAKCYIFDSETILISSGNLTPSGMSNNIELSMRLKDKQEASKLTKIIFEDYVPAGTRITLHKITEMKEEINAFLTRNKKELTEYTNLIAEKNTGLTRFKSKSILINSQESGDYSLEHDIDIDVVDKPIRISSIKVKSEPTHPFEAFKAEDEWYVSYGQLVAFRNTFPDRWPTTKYAESGSWELAIWSDRQRELKLMQKLAPSRQYELDKINFEYSRSEAAWQYGLVHLRHFLEENIGDWPFIDERTPGFRLGDWLTDNRKATTEGKLSPQKIKALDNLGMVWNEEEAEWKSLLRLLKLYRSKKPTRWPFKNEKIRGYKLYPTLKAIVAEKDKLSPKQIEDLQDLNFPLDDYVSVTANAEWMYNYDHAKEILQKEGQLPSKSHPSYIGKRTAYWLDEQVKKVRKKPNSGRRPLLEELGIEFEV